MPVRSCLALPSNSEFKDLVPFNPQFNPSTITAILEMSFLTMTLKCHHLHAVLEIHNIYSLNFHLASRIWCVLKDLSRTSHKAADPTVDPFESLSPYINPNRLSEIGMNTPQILMIEKYSQNMLFSTPSFDHVFKLFKMVQTVILDAARWIEEAK
jgi:hypothetical protein